MEVAAAQGLEVPLVWNCGGYENVEALRLLEGVVDIYMPDLKFARGAPAARFCDAADYFDRACEAVREMHRQVGDLAISPDGIGRRGLLVRHLVLPEGLAGTAEVARFLAGEISRDTYLNVMDQYRPCHRAGEFPELSRAVTPAEFRAAVTLARRAGLHRGFL
jgi:putative pyruvate formate lyase activating enzyme